MAKVRLTGDVKLIMTIIIYTGGEELAPLCTRWRRHSHGAHSWRCFACKSKDPVNSPAMIWSWAARSAETAQPDTSFCISFRCLLSSARFSQTDWFVCSIMKLQDLTQNTCGLGTGRVVTYLCVCYLAPLFYLCSGSSTFSRLLRTLCLLPNLMGVLLFFAGTSGFSPWWDTADAEMKAPLIASVLSSAVYIISQSSWSL